MLNFIYWPVSWILRVWHEVFGFLLGPDNGIAWALSVMFLVFTLRAILYKPFVLQVRSMRKMQEFQPEIAKLRKKYANDRTKQAEEMQRLQREHGVNPVAGCLPILVQIPVFIGLFHVLREFGPIDNEGLPRTENYAFDQAGVQSFNDASLFGAKLGSWVVQGEEVLNAAGTSISAMLIVMIPLMIMAGVFTHITARHSVARQTAAQGENPQTAIMNKLMLYVFPIGVVVGAPFLPLAVLLYWVANNLWTLGQQFVVYRKIDRDESLKKEVAAAKAEEQQKARTPKPGQKPSRPERKPGAKPLAPRKKVAGTADPATTDGSTANGDSGPVGLTKNGATTNGTSPHGAGQNGATKNGTSKNGTSKNGATNGTTNGAADATDDADRAADPTGAGQVFDDATGSDTPPGGSPARSARGGTSRPSQRRRRKR